MDSLLINLASGAVGALLGAFAAYRLQVRESQKLAKGAARAVYLELTGNLTHLQEAKPGGHMMGSYTRDTWQAEQARLAAYLTAEQMMYVSYAYALFPNGQRALDALRAGGPAPFTTELQMTQVVAKGVYQAAMSLHPIVWTKAEQKRVDKLAEDVRKVGGV